MKNGPPRNGKNGWMFNGSWWKTSPLSMLFNIWRSLQYPCFECQYLASCNTKFADNWSPGFSLCTLSTFGYLVQYDILLWQHTRRHAWRTWIRVRVYLALTIICIRFSKELASWVHNTSHFRLGPWLSLDKSRTLKVIKQPAVSYYIEVAGKHQCPCYMPCDYATGDLHRPRCYASLIETKSLASLSYT